jgi:hypothetical protein
MKKITLLLFCLMALSLNAQVTIFSDDFEAETVDATTYTYWTSIDDDLDGNFWEVADIGAYAIVNAPNHPMQSLAADSDSWEGAAFTPNNYLTTTDPIDLTNFASTMLTYTVGTYQTNGTFTDDQYSIYLTTSNSIGDINAATPVTTRLVSDDAVSDSGDGANSAAVVELDISMYDGQVVYLTFRHYNSIDINSVLIDDVLVEANNLSVGEFERPIIQHTFNNDTKLLTLDSQEPLKSVTIFNILGQETLKVALAGNHSQVNLSSLQAGIYIAKIMGDNNASKTIKLAVK